MEKSVETVEKYNEYRTSRISYVPNYFIAALTIIFLLLLWQKYNLTFNTVAATNSELISDLIIFGFIVVIIYLIEEADMEKILRQYSVTNNEVVKTEGIIRKKRISIPYQSVADLKVNKGVIGRMFNFGDVEVTGVKENIKMKGMKNPEEIYRLLEKKIARFRGGPRIRKLPVIEETQEEPE